MKSAKVLKILHISRQTLVKYVQQEKKRKLEIIQEDLKNEISL